MSVVLTLLGEDFRQMNTSGANHSLPELISPSGRHDSGAQLMDPNPGDFLLSTAETLLSTDLTMTSTATPKPHPGNTIDLFKFIVLGILGSILAILGFLGNTLSMVVLHRRQMRSSTSYYLLSLAIYDNGILIGMMLYFCLPALIPYAVFLSDYRLFLSFTLPFGYPLSLSCQMGSIYTCVGFTVERFIAVCRPLHAANTCTKSRTIRAIIIIFIWSLVYNIPRFFQYNVIYQTESRMPVVNSTLFDLNSYAGRLCSDLHDLTSNHTPCQSNITSNSSVSGIIFNTSDSISEHAIRKSLTNHTNTVSLPTSRRIPVHKVTDFGSDPTFRHLYLIYFQLFFMFLLPFIIILIMNVGLIRAVRSSKSMHMSMCTSARKEHNLTVMLIAVIVVFLVCQFPTIIDNMMVAVVGEATLRGNEAYVLFYIVCAFMVEINAASNFLLYCFFGKKFRLILFSLLGIKRKKHQLAYRSSVCKSRTNGSGSKTYEMEVSVM